MGRSLGCWLWSRPSFGNSECSTGCSQGERPGPKNTQHPSLSLAPNFEAHNTLLELLVQGGLTAMIAFASLCTVAARRAWREGRDGLTTMFFCLTFFSTFHVISRHPTLWFVIVPGAGRASRLVNCGRWLLRD